MQKFRYLRVALLGMFTGIFIAGSAPAPAETLRVIRGDVGNAINVPTGGTVVVDTGMEFDEVLIANRTIADISTLTSRLVAITGSKAGRTTFSIYYPSYHYTNFEILVAPNLPDSNESNPVSLPDISPAEIMPVLDGTTTNALALRLGEAVVVNRDVPFRDIAIGNLGIADGVAETDSAVYLRGKNIGRTTLSFLRDDGSPATVVQVEVLPNTEVAE